MPWDETAMEQGMRASSILMLPSKGLKGNLHSSSHVNSRQHPLSLSTRIFVRPEGSVMRRKAQLIGTQPMSMHEICIPLPQQKQQGL